VSRLFTEVDFFEAEPELITLEGGELVLIRHWLEPSEAERYFAELRGTIAWEQSTLILAGKPVHIPRLNAWYGDEGRNYGYSGKHFRALPWSETLSHLKASVQQRIDQCRPDAGFAINSALLNLYRDGNDSVGWHSDDEAELGPRPQIASVSLGAARRFLLKHRRDKSQKHELVLSSGSLLLMLGDIQRHWLHAVPKTRKPVGERINITFRQVIT
jgi:alkylated DNA repair dioxygenase AlkB